MSTRPRRNRRKSKQAIESEASQRAQHPMYDEVSDATSADEDESDDWHPPLVNPSKAEDDIIEKEISKFQVHWTEARRRRNKYILGEVHEEFMQNYVTHRSRGSGPNMKWLATNFSNCPAWLRSASTSFTSSKAAKQGSILDYLDKLFF